MGRYLVSAGEWWDVEPDDDVDEVEDEGYGVDLAEQLAAFEVEPAVPADRDESRLSSKSVDLSGRSFLAAVREVWRSRDEMRDQLRRDVGAGLVVVDDRALPPRYQLRCLDCRDGAGVDLARGPWESVEAHRLDHEAGPHRPWAAETKHRTTVTVLPRLAL